MSKQTVLVTGASKRIGRVIALELFKAGFAVAIHYGESRQEAEQLASECGGAALFQADLTDVQQIRRMFARIREQLGGLDCLVNNAARFTRFDPLQITEADWDFIHEVNLKATFFCCQEAALQMQQRGAGRIVNISSLGGLRPWADHVHYCASKAGVIMMTKALAKALAPRITVNSVAPGVIPFGADLAEDPSGRIHSMIEATPMKRAGRGEDIAAAVLFFLTAPTFITGQIMAVDGGLADR